MRGSSAYCAWSLAVSGPSLAIQSRTVDGSCCEGFEQHVQALAGFVAAAEEDRRALGLVRLDAAEPLQLDAVEQHLVLAAEVAREPGPRRRPTPRSAGRAGRPSSARPGSASWYDVLSPAAWKVATIGAAWMIGAVMVGPGASGSWRWRTSKSSSRSARIVRSARRRVRRQRRRPSRWPPSGGSCRAASRTAPGGGPSHGASTRASWPERRGATEPARAPGPGRHPGWRGCRGTPGRPASRRGYATPATFAAMSPATSSAMDPGTGTDRPALSLVATAGKRQAVLDAAVEAERRGFAGLACPSLGGDHGPVRVARPRHLDDPVLDVDPADLPGHRRSRPAAIAAHLAGGQRAGGSASASASATGPCTRRLGVDAGRPLSRHAGLRRCACTPARRAAVRSPRSTWPRCGTRCWAWPPRSPTARSGPTRPAAHMAAAARPGAGRRPGRLLRRQHGADGHRRRPRGGRRHQPAHAQRLRHASRTTGTTGSRRATWRRWRPSRRRWPPATATAVPTLMSDAWLHDCTLGGSAAEVREGIEAWRDLGRHCPSR